MAAIPEWALTIVNSLPESTQQNLMTFGAKALQQPYTIPFATIPFVYSLIFLPHSIKLGLMLPSELFNYNNQNPRNTNLKERGYPEWQQQLIQRLVACHLNTFEIFPVYAAAILTCHAAKVKADDVMPIAKNFIKARILYFIFYVLSFSQILSYGRTLIWFASVKYVFDLYALALF